MRRQTILTGILLLFLLENIHAQCVKGNCHNGYGTFTYKSGAMYKGDFWNGQINGQGILYFSNGDKYIGQWNNNRREGKGKMMFADGDIYMGNFKQNKFHGHGIMEYNSGGEYDGNWADNLFEGKGIFIYADGRKYSGDWKRGKRHGTGKLILVTGEIQDGTWIADEFQTEDGFENLSAEVEKNLRNCNLDYCENGKGIYTYSDGSRYIGEFLDGKPQGRGVCYYHNGDSYEGQWQDHAPHGEGIYTYKNKAKVAAIWNFGRPVQQLDVLKQEEGEDRYGHGDEGEVKIWSVVVGVSTYEHMPTLRFTDDDAYRFYAFLKSPEGGALADNQIKILIDENATRNNILSALEETLLKADGNDVIVFYFSGHGLEGSFIPVDYDGFNNQLMHDEIKRIFEKSRAKHKMIFADACYSGGLLAMKSPIQQMIRNYYSSFEKTNGGLAFFTSSKEAEISLEDGGLRQGIFTHFLIRGLNGEADTNRNKIVTIKEVATYVRKNVRDYTAKVQTPVLTGNYDTNMPVAVIR